MTLNDVERVKSFLSEKPEVFAQERVDIKKIVDDFHTNTNAMLNNTNVMKNLMLDLLDLAQMGNNKFKLNKDFFSLNTVIDNAISVVQHLAERKHVSFVKNIENTTE